MGAVYQVHNASKSTLAIPIEDAEPSNRDTVLVGPQRSVRVNARQLLAIRRSPLFKLKKITILPSEGADVKAAELAALKGKALKAALNESDDAALLEEAAVAALEEGKESTAKAIEKRIAALGAVLDATEA